MNLISSSQAASLLGLSGRGARWLSKNGKLRKAGRVGRTDLFLEEDVRALLRERGKLGKLRPKKKAA